MMLKANISVFRFSRLSIDCHFVIEFKTENPVNSALISKGKKNTKMCVAPLNFMLLSNQRQLIQKYCDLPAAKCSACNSLNSEIEEKKKEIIILSVTLSVFISVQEIFFQMGKGKKSTTLKPVSLV